MSLAVFACGAVVGGWFVIRGHRGRQLGFLAEWLCILAAVVVTWSAHAGPQGSARFVVFSVLALAMGIQSSLMRRWGLPDLATNVMTLTFTALLSESPLGGGNGARWVRRGTRQGTAAVSAGSCRSSGTPRSCDGVCQPRAGVLPVGGTIWVSSPRNPPVRGATEPPMDISRTFARLHVDFRPRPDQPSMGRVLAASAVALAGSVAVDVAAVALGKAWFPSTRGFVHFRVEDYLVLTIIGVGAACAAWPAVTRISSAPRWVFVRLAVVVTLILWIPDLWILARGETAAGVGVLMVMHLGIAVVTYNSLVRLAPVGRARVFGTDGTVGIRGPAAVGVEAEEPPGHRRAEDSAVRDPLEHQSIWWAMSGFVGVELLLGIWTLVSVPAGRPSGFIPPRGTTQYAFHVLVGAVLGVCAVALVLAARRSSRDIRLGANLGCIGVALGGLGGIAVADHHLRVLGMVVMFLGVGIAAMGYLLPAVLLADGRVPPSMLASPVVGDVISGPDGAPQPARTVTDMVMGRGLPPGTLPPRRPPSR